MIVNKNILIVDVDQDLISINRKMLKQINKNYTVFTADSSHKAFEIAKELRPDIIITDWDMPEISGRDFMKALKRNSRTKDIPVIMTSSMCITPKDLNRALNAGAVDYIHKPFIKVDLESRVNSALLLSQNYMNALNIKKAKLTDSTLKLMKNKEFLINIQDNLKQLKDTICTLENCVNNMTSEISLHLKSEEWNHSEASFQSIHSGFNKEMLKRYPNLSPKELKLSSLLRLGKSSKDIASIFSISENSVKVSRSRLRKKIKLPEKENLQNFLTCL